jgi:hypothetical protein
MCAIRFWVESVCTVFDDVAGTCVAYYQCASCKSEDTFGKGTELSGRNLFQVVPLGWAASQTCSSSAPRVLVLCTRGCLYELTSGRDAMAHWILTRSSGPRE